ncbi:MAG TPA: PP2C family protein-serine/threonine phosphatase [Vicinamibacteria bacterium]|nr:PP2C family protein-serine/threonine phosphatase [Vicinamibacteria bacterium]
MDLAHPALPRDEVVAVATGTAFVVIGILAGAVAAVRRRGGVRVFAWLGVWSALYGLQELAGTASVVAALPSSMQAAVPFVKTTISYLVVVAATLAWRELSVGRLRRLLEANVVAGLAIAAGGVGASLARSDARVFALGNALLAVFGLLVLVAAVVLPETLLGRDLRLPHRGVLAAGTLAFAIEALYANLARPLGYPSPRLLDSLGFAALLFAFGWVALRMVVDRERRLLSIENELAVARRLQLSILPTATPDLRGARVAAVYEPMTAVAGDFYEFLPVDERRAGFLVADVSGHGVPAALIASMIKVAVHSVAASAADPAELLVRLRGALHGHLRGQYVTAACLWLDTEARTARYSAAGHPPLALWRAAEDRLSRVESNGILFGVEVDSPYPTLELALAPGDRLVLYTDGLTEAENASGEPFGDSRLEQVLNELRSRPAEEASRALLAAVRAWVPPSVPQQDDITLLVIDLLERLPREPGPLEPRSTL